MQACSLSYRALIVIAIAGIAGVPYAGYAQIGDDPNPDEPLYFGIKEPEPQPVVVVTPPVVVAVEEEEPKHWSNMSYGELEAEQARLENALAHENMSPVEKKNLRNLLKRVEAERIRLLGQPQGGEDVQVPSLDEVKGKREQRQQELKDSQAVEQAENVDNAVVKEKSSRDKVLDTIRNRRYGAGAAAKADAAAEKSNAHGKIE